MPRKGQKMSADQKAKISVKMKVSALGNKNGASNTTEAAKRKNRLSNLGVKRSQETKRRIRANNAMTKSKNEHTVGYLHLVVAEKRGKPNFCEVCGTEENWRFVWASPDHTRKSYEDVDSYIRMCTKCHRSYDNKEAAYLRGVVGELRAEIEQLKRGE